MLITGNTYPVKDQLRALGGKWKPAEKAWDVPTDKAAEAQALVAGAPVAKRSSSYSATKPGCCCNCGDQLSAWERNHGVRRCIECRDGGGNAHGGMSYRDRNGNFVLGDDD